MNQLKNQITATLHRQQDESFGFSLHRAIGKK